MNAQDGLPNTATPAMASPRKAVMARRMLIAGIVMALVQSVIIGGQIVKRAAVLRHGADLKLRSEAVDPRDLMRGDYVILTYAISRLRLEGLKGPMPAEGTPATFYVRLTPDAEGYGVPSEISSQPLAAQPGSVVLASLPEVIPSGSDATTEITVRYGIERFYVPEGEGKAIEDSRNQGQVSVALKVPASGRAQIHQLFIGDQAVYQEPAF